MGSSFGATWWIMGAVLTPTRFRRAPRSVFSLVNQHERRKVKSNFEQTFLFVWCSMLKGEAPKCKKGFRIVSVAI